MKTLALILLLIPASVGSQPILMIPVGQDSVPLAEFTRYHDSISAPMKAMSVWSFGDAPQLWFVQSPDSSLMYPSKIGTVRVWGFIDKDVEIQVATGVDKNNEWALAPIVENPPARGYGAHDFVFAVNYNRPARFVYLARYAMKGNGDENGQGHVAIDCVELLPKIQSAVEVLSPVQKRSSTRWRDVLGRSYGSLEHVASGVYLGDLGEKRIVIR